MLLSWSRTEDWHYHSPISGQEAQGPTSRIQHRIQPEPDSQRKFAPDAWMQTRTRWKEMVPVSHFGRRHSVWRWNVFRERPCSRRGRHPTWRLLQQLRLLRCGLSPWETTRTLRALRWGLIWQYCNERTGQIGCGPTYTNTISALPNLRARDISLSIPSNERLISISSSVRSESEFNFLGRYAFFSVQATGLLDLTAFDSRWCLFAALYKKTKKMGTLLAIVPRP